MLIVSDTTPIITLMKGVGDYYDVSLRQYNIILGEPLQVLGWTCEGSFDKV